jgi:hypothetical protein
MKTNPDVSSNLLCRFSRARLVFLAVVILPAILRVPGAGAEAPYQEVFYQSGKLRLQAYLYKPQGVGPLRTRRGD